VSFKILKGFHGMTQVRSERLLYVVLQPAADNQQAGRCGPRDDEYQRGQQQNTSSNSWTLFVEHRIGSLYGTNL
jgi:hypothetical protein